MYDEYLFWKAAMQIGLALLVLANIAAGEAYLVGWL